MAKDKKPASTILHEVQTRQELRTYIDERLPGWHCWLDVALAVLAMREQDELKLVTQQEIAERIRLLADEMYQELGELGAKVGREYAQKVPFFDLSDQCALEPWSRWPGSGSQLELEYEGEGSVALPTNADLKGVRPFSHSQLGERVASRDVIGNLLAMAHLKTLSRQRRDGLELRRTWAAHMVAVDFGPYLVKTQGPDVPVLPPQYEDPGFDPRGAVTGQISKALATVVTVYLGEAVPPSMTGDMPGNAVLNLPDNTFKKAAEKLREALRQPDRTVWTISQGQVDLGKHSPAKPPYAK